MLIEERRKINALAGRYYIWVRPVMNTIFLVSIIFGALGGEWYGKIFLFLCLAFAISWLTMPVLFDLSRGENVDLPIVYFRVDESAEYPMSLLGVIGLILNHVVILGGMSFDLIVDLF